jgi:eukaryotic-like serine/threonine-protein kinase
VRYEFGPFRLDCRTRELWRGDVRVTLTPKAFDLLRVLVAAGNRVVEKDELMKLVWPDSFVSEDSLTQHIAALRKALGDGPERPQYILTVPRHGYRFIAEVRHLSDPCDPVTAPAPAARHGGELPGRRAALIGAGAAGGLALLVTGFAVGRQDGPLPRPRAIRFVVNAPPTTTFASSGLLSPDGRHLAYVVRDRSGRTRLFIRGLDAVEPQPLPGTEDAQRPFWSPDSQFVAFFAQGSLKTIAIVGSPVQTLTSVGQALGGSWSRDGRILFAANRRSGLYAIPAPGGTAIRVTAVDQANHEGAHRWPQFSPDGQRYLFSVVSSDPDRQGVYEGDLGSTDRRRVLDGSYSAAIYASPGYLLSVRDATLLAVAVDRRGHPTGGPPAPIASGVAAPDPANGIGISVAGDILAFSTDTSPSHLVWFDRLGARLGSIETPGNLTNPALSSDDSQVIAQQQQVNGEGGIWLMDVRRGARTRLTVDGTVPLWSPDGQFVVFTSGRARGVLDVYRRQSNGAGDDELVFKSATNKRVHGWSPDGQYIVYVNTDPTTKDDLWLLPMSRDRTPTPYLRTPFNERGGQVSPDGRWMAYMSDESGSWDVYVQSFPQAGNKRAISIHGGVQPQWRRDGRELFFLAPDHTLMAVDVRSGPTFDAGVPRVLFRAPIAGDLMNPRNQYATSADGQRFLIETADVDLPPSIVVVLNWQSALGARERR